MNRMWTKRVGIWAVVVAMLMLGVAPNVAVAGEITGNGKWIAGSPDAPLQGNSECAYSGQQDDPTEPGANPIAQAWGLIAKFVRDFLTSIGNNPGVACNPTRAT